MRISITHLVLQIKSVLYLMVTSMASEEGLVNASSTGHAYNNDDLIHHPYCVTQYFTLN